MRRRDEGIRVNWNGVNKGSCKMATFPTHWRQRPARDPLSFEGDVTETCPHRFHALHPAANVAMLSTLSVYSPSLFACSLLYSPFSSVMAKIASCLSNNFKTKAAPSSLEHSSALDSPVMSSMKLKSFELVSASTFTRVVLLIVVKTEV